MKLAQLLSCLAATRDGFHAEVDHCAADLHSLVVARNKRGTPPN
jgi:hypothetical protein